MATVVNKRGEKVDLEAQRAAFGRSGCALGATNGPGKRNRPVSERTRLMLVVRRCCLSTEEIAIIAGLSPRAVRYRLTTAMRAEATTLSEADLDEILQDGEGFEDNPEALEFLKQHRSA